MKMEPIVSSETSAIRTQTPGNYPKRNNLHLEHGESLRTRLLYLVHAFMFNNKKRRSIPLGCDAMKIGRHLRTFWRKVPLLSSRYNCKECTMNMNAACSSEKFIPIHRSIRRHKNLHSVAESFVPCFTVSVTNKTAILKLSFT